MSLLFRNRWFALLWMAMTIASASLFVGDGGGVAKLLDTAERIQTQRQQLEAPPSMSRHVIEAEPEESAAPVLLPAGDPDADPLNPKPGDIFIDAKSGRRVQIVSREDPAAPPNQPQP